MQYNFFTLKRYFISTLIFDNFLYVSSYSYLVCIKFFHSFMRKMTAIFVKKKKKNSQMLIEFPQEYKGVLDLILGLRCENHSPLPSQLCLCFIIHSLMLVFLTLKYHSAQNKSISCSWRFYFLFIWDQMIGIKVSWFFFFS